MSRFKVAFSDVKEETCLPGSCDKELGGHSGAGIEYWGGMCGLIENRKGHAYSGIE